VIEGRRTLVAECEKRNHGHAGANDRRGAAEQVVAVAIFEEIADQD
jgi:hypothetical protein